MKIILITFMFLSIPVWADLKNCPEILEVTLENKKTVTYCQFQKLMVSKDCFSKKDKCELVKLITDKKSLISNSLIHGGNQNPGSWACDQLGLEVLMGKMWDGSDLCTCQNKMGESVICTSLTY